MLLLFKLAYLDNTSISKIRLMKINFNFGNRSLIDTLHHRFQICNLTNVLSKLTSDNYYIRINA